MLKSAFDDISFFDLMDRDEYIAKRKLEYSWFTRIDNQDGLCKGIPYVYDRKRNSKTFLVKRNWLK